MGNLLDILTVIFSREVLARNFSSMSALRWARVGFRAALGQGRSSCLKPGWKLAQRRSLCVTSWQQSRTTGAASAQHRDASFQVGDGAVDLLKTPSLWLRYVQHVEEHSTGD